MERKINAAWELEQSIRCLARQQGADWEATYSVVEGQTIRPCMADGHTHSFAVSHNTRKRKWESFAPRPGGPRGNGRRAQHEERKKLQFIVNYIKRNPRISLFSSFCASQQKIIPFVAACNTCYSRQTHGQQAEHQTQFYDRSAWTYLYWDHGQGAQSAKYKEPRRIRRRRQAAESRRRPSLDSDVIADLWCIYRGGMISTLFPCSHMSRCEAEPWR